MPDVKFEFEEEKDPFDCTKEEVEQERLKMLAKVQSVEEAPTQEAPAQTCVPAPTYVGQPAVCGSSKKLPPITGIYQVNIRHELSNGRDEGMQVYVEAPDIQQVTGKVLEYLVFKGISTSNLYALEIYPARGDFIR